MEKKEREMKIFNLRNEKRKMLAPIFYTHKADFLPDKVEEYLEVVGYEMELIFEDNHKMLTSYFKDIRGLITRNYIIKIEPDLVQGLNDIIMRDAVYHKFRTAYGNAKYPNGYGGALDPSKVDEA